MTSRNVTITVCRNAGELLATERCLRKVLWAAQTLGPPTPQVPLALEEGQEIRIDRLGMRGGHTVREILVGF